MMARKRKKGLSDRQKRILEVLEDFQNEAGYPPSIREICENANISSTSVVNYYLDQLEKSGHIERDRRISRGLRITGQTPIGEMFKVPVLGRIQAGEPIMVPGSDFNYLDPDESVEIAMSLMPPREKGKDLFALQVHGTSMIDAMVNDGDIVVMKPVQEAKNGDMVAVWLPDRSETTLKYFYKERDRFRLQPANPTMKPIYIDKADPLEIRGKVVMVIRKVETPS